MGPACPLHTKASPKHHSINGYVDSGKQTHHAVETVTKSSFVSGKTPDVHIEVILKGPVLKSVKCYSSAKGHASA